ncbi:MAG TPA: molybdopterin cofactor-binding domain-containing protein [Candidatus Dormibacteraeota bacterium]|nr:molybdopterin cofactor-binding domain-containing protein [Candidatus Dormibacteraeota bacterium]
MAVSTLIGAKIQRREDPRLVSGRARYVDDLQPTRVLHAAFVRSPYGHAKIKRIELTKAVKSPGVAAIYTARDFEKLLNGAIPVTVSFVPDKKQAIGWAYIAKDEARYNGEVVAVVLANERYQAADAAALVDVEYEPLTPVTDLEAATKGGPTAHTGGPDNIAWDYTAAGGDVKAAFAEADVVVKQRIIQQRLFPIAMEGRAVVADFVPVENKLTMWTSTQVPHWVRLCLTLATGIPESNIRVIAPDVGGGFGSKIHIYPEEYLLAMASKLSGQPVKWVEGRTENLAATHHGRAQIFDVELGAKKDGTLLGYKVTQYVDSGAYVSVFSSFMASAYVVAAGAYDLKNVEFRTVGVLTNTTPTDAYRGAGRPEATHAIERAVDMMAQKLNMDPAELRRKNFSKQFPHANYLGISYDSGDYDKALTRALEKVGYSDLRKQQEELRKKGRYLGIGLSTWIEVCGFGPTAITTVHEPLGLVETAVVRMHPTGSVSVYTGTSPHGQGHDTTFAQIAADTLGVPIDAVEVHHGDTGDTPFGYGTYGSRSLHVGGSAVLMSSRKIVDKAKKIAAHMLEASEEDIVFDQGRFSVKGSPDKAKTIGEVAFKAHLTGLPEGMENGLEAVTYYDPPDLSWPFGAHVCVVEVDAETGNVRLQKYVAVDDCGNVINPMIVEGQVHGGVVQGIAQALYEEVLYDPDSGALKTGTLLDYMIPTANEIPEFITDRTVTPSTTNPLGVKGIGEAGTIASSVAVINAVVDALSPFGIDHVDMPASPDRVWAQIKEARQ